jgi:dTDP-4-amino-4,6-dideoxygalactose transaminase
VNQPRQFIQTGASGEPALDRWKQVGEEEVKIVQEMTARNELSGGTPVVREFEAEWKRFSERKYALTTVNGTAALYSALFGLGVGPGDEVISPTWNWICSIAPAPFLGARPVFCDIDPRTMLVDPEDMRRKITPRTKAIIVVHLWGWVCNMDEIMEVARKAGVRVIEDCSHAHGARWRGKPVGGSGAVACWSLQGSKPVSAGEGGVIATDDDDIFERACLAGQVNRIAGLDLATPRYESLQPLGTGMKFRAHPLGIGIASVQLKKLPALNAGRTRWVEAMEKGLESIPCLEPVAPIPGSTRGGFYSFPVHYHPERNAGITAAAFVEALKKAGVRAGLNSYPLLHTLPYFAEGFDLFTGKRGPLTGDYPGYKKGDLPNAEKCVENIIFLPVLTDPVDGAVEWMLERVKGVIK